jgi:hypothetical protein
MRKWPKMGTRILKESSCRAPRMLDIGGNVAVVFKLRANLL